MFLNDFIECTLTVYISIEIIQIRRHIQDHTHSLGWNHCNVFDVEKKQHIHTHTHQSIRCNLHRVKIESNGVGIKVGCTALFERK